jgi:hypothetical protein
MTCNIHPLLTVLLFLLSFTASTAIFLPTLRNRPSEAQKQFLSSSRALRKQVQVIFPSAWTPNHLCAPPTPDINL